MAAQEFRINPVEVWLDAGIPDALLETNRYLLEHGHDNSVEAAKAHPGVAIIPPVFIHPSATIENPPSLARTCRWAKTAS